MAAPSNLGPALAAACLLALPSAVGSKSLPSLRAALSRALSSYARATDTCRSHGERTAYTLRCAAISPQGPGAVRLRGRGTARTERCGMSAAAVTAGMARVRHWSFEVILDLHADARGHYAIAASDLDHRVNFIDGVASVCTPP